MSTRSPNIVPSIKLSFKAHIKLYVELITSHQKGLLKYNTNWMSYISHKKKTKTLSGIIFPTKKKKQTKNLQQKPDTFRCETFEQLLP